MISRHRSNLQRRIEAHTAEASTGVNHWLDVHPMYDQTKGNRCDLLTSSVLARLSAEGDTELSRELHQDDAGNWHYLLAHKEPESEPTDEDLMSDLNPWQWGGSGQGIMHLPRHELMERLSQTGAPDYFVALRSLTTITKNHDIRNNPFS